MLDKIILAHVLVAVNAMSLRPEQHIILEDADIRVIRWFPVVRQPKVVRSSGFFFGSGLGSGIQNGSSLTLDLHELDAITVLYEHVILDSDVRDRIKVSQQL